MLLLFNVNRLGYVFFNLYKPFFIIYILVLADNFIYFNLIVLTPSIPNWFVLPNLFILLYELYAEIGKLPTSLIITGYMLQFIH